MFIVIERIIVKSNLIHLVKGTHMNGFSMSTLLSDYLIQLNLEECGDMLKPSFHLVGAFQQMLLIILIPAPYRLHQSGIDACDFWVITTPGEDT